MTNIIESVKNTSENVKVAVEATGEVLFSNAKDLYNDIIKVAKEKKYIDKAVQEEEGRKFEHTKHTDQLTRKHIEDQIQKELNTKPTEE